MNNAKRRVMDQIVKHSGTASIGLLACDLRLATDTVRRHVKSLVADGRAVFGWDGQALEPTVAELAERAQDARVARHD